ncbi:MAG: DUF86 domain-containing protein [Methanoregulaceae archaeon]
MTKSDAVYLRHVLDACATLVEVRDRAGSASGLEALPVERAAAERLLTVIGEAAKNVSPGFRALHPEIPWKGMAGLRDRLVHHYFGVDYEAVWATIIDDLPGMEVQVRAALEAADT